MEFEGNAFYSSVHSFVCSFILYFCQIGPLNLQPSCQQVPGLMALGLTSLVVTEFQNDRCQLTTALQTLTPCSRQDQSPKGRGSCSSPPARGRPDVSSAKAQRSLSLPHFLSFRPSSFLLFNLLGFGFLVTN